MSDNNRKTAFNSGDRATPGRYVGNTVTQPATSPDVIKRRRNVAGGALAGIAVTAAIKLGLVNLPWNSAPERSDTDSAVPADTREYLSGLPTREVTIKPGEGVDDAIYKVDGDTIDASADIKQGVSEMLDAQVPHTETGVAVPQAGQKVDVPVVPEIESIPPDAR